jgi:hypothetical protein
LLAIHTVNGLDNILTNCSGLTFTAWVTATTAVMTDLRGGQEFVPMTRARGRPSPAKLNSRNKPATNPCPDDESLMGLWRMNTAAPSIDQVAPDVAQEAAGYWRSWRGSA